MNVKKFAAFTTALVLAMCVAPSYTAAAQGGGECVYPTEFTNELNFTSLADYAVHGGTRAYAQSTKLYIIEPDEFGDEYLKEFDCGFEITDIEYGGDTLYLRRTDDMVYSYPSLTIADYAFEERKTITCGSFEYNVTDSGGLYVIDRKGDNMPVIIFEEGCTHLKMYDEQVYVMYGGEVYELNGTEKQAVPAEYTDLSAADRVNTGNAAELLAASYSVQTVTVHPQTTDGHDTYITKIDLEDVGETFDSLGTERLTGDHSALAVAEVGNATIIVMPDENGLSQSYITLTSATEKSDYSAPALDMRSAYALADISLYSRPYMCGATEIAQLESGTIVSVEEKFELDFFDNVFYKVTATVNGESVTGYAPQKLLSPYTFSAENDKEQTTGSDDFEYGSEVQKVIVVLLIVLLALAAIGYVTVYVTKNGDGKSRRRKTPPPDDGMFE